MRASARIVDIDHVPRPRPRLIAWIADPKAVSTLAAGSWLVIAQAGFWAFGSPPTSVANELGAVITTTWAVLFILGGVLAVVGALPGWWYLERAGILILSTGLAIYGGVVWYLHYTVPGNRAVQGSVIIALIILSMARYARISGATLDPSRGKHRAQTKVAVAE